MERRTIFITWQFSVLLSDRADSRRFLRPLPGSYRMSAAAPPSTSLRFGPRLIARSVSADNDLRVELQP
jgi:hypothetical protein